MSGSKPNEDVEFRDRVGLLGRTHRPGLGQLMFILFISLPRTLIIPLSRLAITGHYPPNVRLYECDVLCRLPGNHASVTLGFLALGLIFRPFFQPPRPQLIPHLTSGSYITLSRRPARMHPVTKVN